MNAERYAAPLPQLTGEVATLAACVAEPSRKWLSATKKTKFFNPSLIVANSPQLRSQAGLNNALVAELVSNLLTNCPDSTTARK